MIDEREADDVRAWLATADTVDVRVDLGFTMDAGRARARRRRIGQIAATGALALAVLAGVPGVIALADRDATGTSPVAAARTPPPDGPFSCTFQALPAPEGVGTSRFNIDIEAIDPSGRYVIAQAIPHGDPRGARKSLLWDNGVGQVLPAADSRPTAVSENGVVAGNSMSDNRAWLYRNGTVSDIPVPAGAAAVDIVDIDRNGDLLGAVTAGGTVRTAVWRSNNLANPEFLDVPGDIVSPTRFLAGGGVLGYGVTGRKLYMWNAERQLATYTPPAGADESKTVVTPDGWVTAAGHRPNREEMIAVRWKLDTGEVEFPALPTVTPPAASFLLKDIARNGALLYSATTRMFVVRGDHVAQLPAPDGLEAYAQDINEFGTRIAGRVSQGANTLDGLTMALWTC
jgi:hypothetical protein